ncbi:NADH:ubiquinone oxidoreductase subunit NDUFA12 [Sphingorhabdus sp. SMR4y]|uniref:NADH:ubiquinone oxidoreductase subunit NDUFA12 n=1 Tax=Sphingorhabdus sp. SMR4y TaxID=2584094 RepID=UPI000B5CA286|nr:NADH:ubiquinone oxidoreductase subunit NDUFA12 [Sphingorhabdus sp. SMR4y]ASK88729.1 NADH dehydrogenase [Sphingorhabdus sp. SMR4y]
MNILAKIFTWWNGATIGTALFSARKGKRVGEDVFGNIYYQTKNGGSGYPAEKRWVIYNGSNDASRVPPEWHGWLHHSYDEIPESHLPQPRIWEKEPSVNLTGTAHAYRPAGALEQGGHRAAATGDYESWNPAEAE